MVRHQGIWLWAERDSDRHDAHLEDGPTLFDFPEKSRDRYADSMSEVYYQQLPQEFPLV